MKVYKLYDVVALKKQKKYFDIYMDVYDFFNYEIETYNDTSVVMDDYQTVITSEGSFLRVDIVAEDYEELTPEEILEINPNFNFEELCEGSSLLKVEDGIVSEVLYSFDCDVNDFKEAAKDCEGYKYLNRINNNLFFKAFKNEADIVVGLDGRWYARIETSDTTFFIDQRLVFEMLDKYRDMEKEFDDRPPGFAPGHTNIEDTQIGSRKNIEEEEFKRNGDGPDAGANLGPTVDFEEIEGCLGKFQETNRSSGPALPPDYGLYEDEEKNRNQDNFLEL